MFVYTDVYMARTRPCKGGVHTACTQSCTRAVCTACTQPYKMAVYTSRTQSCTRAVCTACTRPYTRPCIRPLYGRVLAVYTAENVYTGRVHGLVTCRLHGRVHSRVHDTLHGRVHGPYTAVFTAGTRPCNCRVHVSCKPCTWRCNGCVHVYTCSWAV